MVTTTTKCTASAFDTSRLSTIHPVEQCLCLLPSICPIMGLVISVLLSIFFIISILPNLMFFHLFVLLCNAIVLTWSGVYYGLFCRSTTSSSKDRRSMSRSAGETPSSMLGGNSGQLQQTLTQRKGVREPPTIKVAFFLLDEPIPYSVTVPGTEITLAKFKEQITKKGGNYR